MLIIINISQRQYYIIIKKLYDIRDETAINDNENLN